MGRKYVKKDMQTLGSVDMYEVSMYWLYATVRTAKPEA